MTNYYPLTVAALTALFVWLWFLTQCLIGKKASSAPDNVFDRLHVWSAPLHQWLFNKPRVANAVLIATSLWIDAMAIFLLGSAIFGSTLQPLLAVVIVMILRQLCHFVSTLPTPSGIIWRYPGFPSLFVTYDVSNDFFFSGHTAIALLGAFQLMHVAPVWLIAIGFFVVLVQAMSVIVLRAHYTIDVFAGIFVAWTANLVASYIAPALDIWVRHLLS